MKRCLLTIFSLCIIHAASAQSFEVRISDDQLMAEKSFELAFVLIGGPADQISFPPLDGFEILSGPEESPEMINVDGSLQQQIVYRYQLQAARPGTKRIGPATATLSDQILSTQMLEVRILAQQEELSQEDIELRNALERSLGRNIRVEATPSATTVYEGEPFTLTYDLWIDAQLSGQVGSISRESTPQFLGFSAILQPSRTDRTLELRRGTRYLRTRISEYRLIAQSASRVRLDTLQVGMTVAIPRSGRRPQNDLEAFQRQFQPGFREYRYLLSSNSPSVTIRPLPSQGKPVDFSGLVGELEAEVRLSDSLLQTGEELHLVFVIEGEADFGLISPPTLTLPPSFEHYPPVISGNEEGNRLELDYTLVVREPGGYSIELPEISFFHPGRRRYETIGGGTATLTVEGASLEIPEDQAQGGSLRQQFEDRLLQHPDGVKARAESWIQQSFWWVMIFVWGLLPLIRIWTIHRRRTLADPDWRREHEFRRKIKQSFHEAESLLASGKNSSGGAALHHSLSLILERYLDLPEEKQTEQTIDRAITASDWTDGQKKELKNLLSLVRESGYGRSEVRAGKEIIGQVKSFLEGMSASSRIWAKKILSVILICGAVSSGMAQSGWEIASGLIERQEYAAAAHMYDSLYQSGLQTVDLFHNWGTAAYRNGDLGRAIWAYEKALRIEPGLSLSRNNLEVLRKEVKGDILPRPDLPFEQDWREVVGRVGVGGWSWFAVGLSILLIGFLGGSWWLPRLEAVRPKVVIVGLVLLGGLLWLRTVADPHRSNGEGIMLRQSKVREAPEGQRELIQLPQGVKVYLGEEISGWRAVTIQDPVAGELSGFVPREVVEAI